MLDRSPLALPANLVGFGRTLRQHGIPVATRQLLSLFRALALTDISDREIFYNASACTLLTRPEDRGHFRRVFDAYWLHQIPSPNAEQGFGGSVSSGDMHNQAALAFEIRQVEADAIEDDGEAGGEPASYSWVERLRSVDFADLTPAEMAQVSRFLAQLPLKLGQRRTRRLKPGGSRRLDLRATLRDSFRHEGEWLRWRRRGPMVQPRPLVVLADISGSMERYSRLLLQFVYATVRHHPTGAEAFVFGTRLTRITRFLRQRDVQSALDQVAARVQDWSGGTRIGDSLHTFNTTWARRMLGRGAIVLLISDGWDRGDPEVLAREVARLQRAAGRLVWLNPLLGAADYRPLTRGLQAALPHVDAFLPAHNLASLEQLAELLGGHDATVERMTFRPMASIRSRGGLAR